METSAEKTKLMTNNTKGISLDVRIGGQKLETVQSFKYLGSVVTDEVNQPSGYDSNKIWHGDQC